MMATFFAKSFAGVVMFLNVLSLARHGESHCSFNLSAVVENVARVILTDGY